jgi:predicted AAA+ superfamily ATPase
LTGRKFLYTLHPLSFSEYLYFKGVITENDLINSRAEFKLQRHTRVEYERRSGYYEEYVDYGGFPEVVLTPEIKTKQLVLKNIFASFFEKDIKVFSDMKDIRELRDLILLLAPRNGNMIDISKIASELGITRVKVYNYLEFLQGIFFLKLVSKQTKGIDKSVAAGKKVYFSDTGILNLVAKVTEGQLFETAVCNQLEGYGNLTFYNRRNSAEIDFILNNETAFEVKIKADMSDFNKLKKLAEGIQLDKYFIISKKYVEMDNLIFPQFI